MKFVADESIDFPIVERLRNEGHLVWAVVEMDSGISDDLVLDHANRQNAVLLTADKDFGELVFRLKRLSLGVVLVRLAGLPAQRKAEIVAQVVAEKEGELKHAFSVITANTLRIRQNLVQDNASGSALSSASISSLSAKIT
jgi:predicted nuclease of predicted toxin-antitoxin system